MKVIIISTNIAYDGNSRIILQRGCKNLTVIKNFIKPEKSVNLKFETLPTILQI